MKKKSATSPVLDYQNPFMKIHHTQANFGDFHKDYFVVDLGPRAGIVILQNDQVLLTRQYRFLIDDYSWEIPGGRVDEGETPEFAATRECLEETGLRCVDLKPLVVYYPGLDNFDNRTSLFYCDQPEIVCPFVAKDAEVVEIRWFDFATSLDMVFAGEILDALTIAGLLACHARIAQSTAGL